MPKSPTGFRRFCLVVAATLVLGGFVAWRWPDPVVERNTMRTSVPNHSAAPVLAVPRVISDDSAPAARTLFTFVHPMNAAELTSALPAPAHEINYVRVNREYLAGKRSPFW